MFDSKIFSLIQKYDREGPRYTSYPTVPHWKSQIRLSDLEMAIEKASQNSPKSLALYTHIPFCEEKCYFCACNVVITKHKEKAFEYLNFLKKELELMGPYIPNFPVTQIHWGGGTPTYLNCEQIEWLFNEFKKHFVISDSAEISIEIDPRVTTLNQLKLLRTLGFNRVSLGVQDFDTSVQSAIHRHQTEEETRRMYQWCRELGFQSVNMDFVYGLPFQTAEGFYQNLKTIIDLNPDRIAFYNYAHVPWAVPWQKMIRGDSLPKPDLKLRFLESALQIFEENGYLPVGMDHFAKPTDELIQALNQRTLRRNFMGYTTQKEALLFAFGVSAISDLQHLYVQNFRKLSDYYQALRQERLPFMRGHLLSADDRLRRYVIMEILCNLVLDIKDIEQGFGISFFDTFENELSILEEMALDELLEMSDSVIRVTKKGRLLIRNICMVFDRYAQRENSSLKRYSRTI